LSRIIETSVYLEQLFDNKPPHRREVLFVG